MVDDESRTLAKQVIERANAGIFICPIGLTSDNSVLTEELQKQFQDLEKEVEKADEEDKPMLYELISRVKELAVKHSPAVDKSALVKDFISLLCEECDEDLP